jgi:hypothetical protein
MEMAGPKVVGPVGRSHVAGAAGVSAVHVPSLQRAPVAQSASTAQTSGSGCANVGAAGPLSVPQAATSAKAIRAVFLTVHLQRAE